MNKSGLEKSAVQLSRTSIFSNWVSNFPFSRQGPRQGPRQAIFPSQKKHKLRLAQGKQNLRAAYPNDKLEFEFFSSLENEIEIMNYTQIAWILLNTNLHIQALNCSRLVADLSLLDIILTCNCDQSRNTHQIFLVDCNK